MIVTVTDKDKKNSIDVEFPAEIRVEKLKQDLAEALQAYLPEMVLPEKITLFDDRLNQKLEDGSTAQGSGAAIVSRL